MPVPSGNDLLMPTLEDAFPTVCEALARDSGGASVLAERQEPFEAMIGVLLDRALGASRAVTAIGALEEAGLLSPEQLKRADVLEIRDALLEKGVSASPLLIAPVKHLAEWLVEHHGGRVESLFNPERSTDWLRGELASIPGVSLAAADAIVLFALKRPSYSVDRATFRVLVRHGWLDASALYDEARDLLVDHASRGGNVSEGEAGNLLIGLAHGMEQIGRRFCRAAAPRCEQCPLESVLPEGGPREADG
jgi:endonuclease-3 related protein